MFATRLATRSRHTLGGAVIVIMTSSLALTGCRKPPADPPAAETEAEAPAAPLTEEGDNGTIAWDVTTQGQVRAVVKATDGRQITRDVTGTITWPGDAADQVRDVSLDASGAVVASGPPLEDELTEIDYALVVEGKVWTGVLHVPRGGTRAIDDDARASLAAPVPAGKMGPNGGVIQMINGEPVEVVADRTTEEVRVYMLGPDFTVIDPGERSIRLGYAAERPDMEVLVREPGATYFVGRWNAGFEPGRLTLAVTFHAETHVGIVGWRFGEHLGCGARAPVVRIAAERSWAPSVSVRAGIGFQMRDRVSVNVHERVNVNVHERVNVNVHERVNVHGHVNVNEHEHEHEHEHVNVNVHEHEHGGRHGNEHENVREHEHERGHAKAPSRGGGKGRH